MAMGDMRVVIPAYEEYDVLNLAQAVNVMAYECWQRKLELESQLSEAEIFTLRTFRSELEQPIPSRGEKDKEQLASRKEVFNFLESLFRGLDSGSISSKEGTKNEGDGDSGSSENLEARNESDYPFNKKELLSLSSIFHRVIYSLSPHHYFRRIFILCSNQSTYLGTINERRDKPSFRCD